jgi:hypothetical protein
MEIHLTQRKIEEYRRRTWPSNLQTLDEMVEFLSRVGLALIFGSSQIPLPKVYYCANDNSDWWEWKDVLQAKKLAYTGRIIRHKATLISMDLLPACLSLYLHSGGYLIYEEEYYWGKLSELANRIAHHLDSNGPTPVDQLRKALMPSGKEHTRRFHAALFELQTKFKTVSVGLVDRGWGVRILGLFINWVPPKIEQAAERMTKEQAFEMIIEQFLKTAGAAPEWMLPRVFGWSPEDASPAIENLLKAGRIESGRIRGKKETWLIHPALL